MKNNTKIVLLSLLVVLLIFNACSQRSDSDITIWHQMFPAEREVLQGLIDQYMQENPGVMVYQRYYETEELRSNFIISSLGGSGPDLIHGPSDQIGPFDVMQIILPLDSLLTEEYIDQFDPKALTWRSGRLYQIGDQIGNHLTLCYNKKLLPEPPKTMSELIRIGKEFTQDIDGDGRPDKYGLVWNFVEPYFFVPFLGGFGGWVMDENDDPTLDTPENIKALKFIKKLRDVDKIIPRECDLDLANLLFQQGNAPMIINGPWSWGDYIGGGIDLGLARIPIVDETGLWPSPMVSPRGYSVNGNLTGEKLEKTVKVLKYLLRKESQLKFTELIRTIPSNREALASSIFDDDIILAQSLYQLQAGKPMPVSPKMRAIWDAMRPNYQALLNGTKTAEEAAAAMQKDALRNIRVMFR